MYINRIDINLQNNTKTVENQDLRGVSDFERVEFSPCYIDIIVLLYKFIICISPLQRIKLKK